MNAFATRSIVVWNAFEPKAKSIWTRSLFEWKAKRVRTRIQMYLNETPNVFQRDAERIWTITFEWVINHVLSTSETRSTEYQMRFQVSNEVPASINLIISSVSSIVDNTFLRLNFALVFRTSLKFNVMNNVVCLFTVYVYTLGEWRASFSNV